MRESVCVCVCERERERERECQTNMSCSVTRRKGDRDKGMDGESGRERDEERK